MRIFDSHTHLNDKAFESAIKACLQTATDLDVTKMAIVGSDAQLNQKALALSKQYENLYAIIGYHPESAKLFTKAAQAQLIEQLQQEKVVALGEIGLDYHWDTSFIPEQKAVFKQQIQIAKSLNLPISVHTRDALSDTYAILKENKVDHGIIHSFNGDSEWLKRFLDLGMHISFSGVVSFKNAKDVQQAAIDCPIDKLLIETDAPYLTPVPYRGKQNQPAYTHYVAQAIADLRQTSIETIAKATYENTTRLFNIGE